MSYSYRDIVKLKFPNKKIQKINDDTYEGIVWNALDISPKPTKEELDTAILNESVINSVSGYNLINTVKVPVLSSTTIISLDNTTPLITEGTQLLEIEIIPINESSKLVVTGSVLVATSATKRNLIIALFKDNVCVATTFKNIAVANTGEMFHFTFIDDTLGQNYNGINPNYSLRMGVNSSATWFVNKINTPLLNNTLVNNGVVFLTC